MNATLEILTAHRSIRKFTDEPLPDGLLETLCTAAQAAATSSFLQGATLIRVTNPESRSTLARCAGGQGYVETAAEFLVLCADLKRAGNYCHKYGKEFEGDFTEQFIIATVDVALMAQNLVIAAESVGLGICYIGGLRNNPQEVSDLLELPRGVYPVFGLWLSRPRPRG
jgi:nitroreductase